VFFGDRVDPEEKQDTDQEGEGKQTDAQKFTDPSLVIGLEDIHNSRHKTHVQWSK